jgi:hypothetical protein
MKLVNSESLVFMNLSIYLVFQILCDERQACRSHFIVYICPPPIKQTTLFTRVPFIYGTFPIDFDMLVMDFDRANVFRIQKLNHQTHLTIGGISDCIGSL